MVPLYSEGRWGSVDLSSHRLFGGGFSDKRSNDETQVPLGTEFLARIIQYRT